MPRSGSSPAATEYQRRLDQRGAENSRLRQVSQRLSLLRGLTFLPAAGLSVYGWLNESASSIPFYLAAVSFLAFLILAANHERIAAQLTTNDHRIRTNQNHLARLFRDFSKLPCPHVSLTPDQEPLSRDLDVFGANSLFQWLCLCQTPLGRETLRDWLLDCPTPKTISDRQAAVQQLTNDVDTREEFQLRGRILSSGTSNPDDFLAWCEQSPWLSFHPTLKWIARVSALTTITLSVLCLLGVVAPAVWYGVLLVLGLNTVVNVIALPSIHKIFETVASKQQEVSHYQALFQLFMSHPLDGDLLKSLRIRMEQGGQEPVHALADLKRRVRFAHARHSALWGLVYLLLQYAILWDVHVLNIIEGWQRRHGSHARSWFGALAEFESLLSLSCLAYDEPTWSFPNVDENQANFAAQQLGHPLLPNNQRVTNDVSLGPPGSFLLVTGSNMSGKSTLLRSVGLNVLLARAGGPTCSVDCRLPPLTIATSMRVGDSLSDGVSFYMAELQRLKQVIDLAKQVAATPERHLLFLLDEILLGTNSAERQIAVVRVIDHLLSLNAIGAISTHDVELANSDKLAEACQAVHFREQIIQRDGHDQMTFDYQMRPGVATTTNAIRLLEMVGLT